MFQFEAFVIFCTAHWGLNSRVRWKKVRRSILTLRHMHMANIYRSNRVFGAPHLSLRVSKYTRERNKIKGSGGMTSWKDELVRYNSDASSDKTTRWSDSVPSFIRDAKTPLQYSLDQTMRSYESHIIL